MKIPYSYVGDFLYKSMQKIELIRSRRKTIVIEVTRDLRVVVKAPYGVSEKEINRFIGEKADWIDKSLRKMQERQQEATKGEELTEQDIRLLVTRAKRIIPPMVDRYARMMGVTYGNITIRMQKSRWGSCSGKGNLNFNCLLMRAPDEITEYVVVHELCHRKEMNHSDRFWAEVEKILPDYKERRKWLKDHGNELTRK
jgi:predicted metal-dependent hydrolase